MAEVNAPARPLVCSPPDTTDELLERLSKLGSEVRPEERSGGLIPLFEQMIRLFLDDSRESWVSEIHKLTQHITTLDQYEALSRLVHSKIHADHNFSPVLLEVFYRLHRCPASVMPEAKPIRDSLGSLLKALAGHLTTAVEGGDQAGQHRIL
jgi:hypothetical protein